MNPPARHSARAWIVVLLGVMLAPSTAAAGECSSGICVGSPCTISGTHLLDDGCFLDFDTKSVTVVGTLKTASYGGSFQISAGSLVIKGRLEALGGEIDVDVAGNFSLLAEGGSPARINVDDSGFLTVYAAGNVDLEGSVISARGRDGFPAGEVIMAAGGDIAVGNPIDLTGAAGEDGGGVVLIAGGNLNVTSAISANGSGADSAGGYIEAQAGSSGTLTIAGVLEATATSNGIADGYIELGPSCNVEISGTLRTRNASLNPGFGVNVIQYLNSLNVTGSNLFADQEGAVMLCRCPDANNDATCDGGCLQGPVGMSQASIIPSSQVIAVASAPCACGNGHVDVGEECDDGNRSNFDGCRYNCKLARCGDGLTDPSEECDDGNGVSGDCCSATCQLEADGSSCHQIGNLCIGGQCRAGLCSNTGPIVCSPLDQCHVAGTCNPAAGCSNPNKVNGTSCNDGNACTQADSCQNGACTGSNPRICAAQDQCHSAGICNPTTGMCPNPERPNGTACNDGNQCTAADTCQSGACVGTALADGNSCDDSNSCTLLDRCMGGMCAGTACLSGLPCLNALGGQCRDSGGGSCQCVP